MESYLQYLGLAGSAFSTVATFYFWLVRARQERPCLRPHVVDKEFFLGIGRDNMRQIGLKVGIVVANYSVLPNAILGARLSVRQREGWQEVSHLAFDKQTPQPFNIPPLQTVLLRLTGTLTFPYQATLEDGGKTLANYLAHFVAQPLEMKLELRHLNNRVDAEVLTWPAEGERTAPALRFSAAA